MPPPSSAKPHPPHPPRAQDDPSILLLLIAGFKLLKSLMLIVVGIGALRLVHRDVQAVIAAWMHTLHLDPDRHFIHGLLLRLPVFKDRALELFGLGSFLYSILFFIEGIGLAMRRRWAEYMTIVMTGLLLPLELYELFRRPTPLRAAILLLNIAVLFYLVYRVRRWKTAHST